MKRYLLFSGEQYYPGGGWTDFGGDFDTVEEAMEAAGLSQRYNWAHIADVKLKKVILNQYETWESEEAEK